MAKPENKRKADDSASGGPAKADRLRNDIDRGAGDKAAFLDPAAAPLGTDDEASGYPPTQEQVDAAREQEVRRDVSDRSKPSPGSLQGRGAGWRNAAIIVAGIALVALIGVAIWLV
jgi:hypothetical protein